MKIIYLQKKWWGAESLLIALAFTGTAFAHSQTGTLDVKKNNPKASYIYSVSCGSGTDHLLTSVTKTSDGGGSVSVHTYKGMKLANGATMTTSTDPNIVNGDSGPLVKNVNNSGIYHDG